MFVVFFMFFLDMPISIRENPRENQFDEAF